MELHANCEKIILMALRYAQLNLIVSTLFVLHIFLFKREKHIIYVQSDPYLVFDHFGQFGTLNLPMKPYHWNISVKAPYRTLLIKT